MCLLPNDCVRLCYSITSHCFFGAGLPQLLGAMELLADAIQQAIRQVEAAELVKARLLKPSIS